MAFDSSSTSKSFVLSEITCIAAGQAASSLSHQTQMEMNCLLEMGIERFALTPIVEKHLMQLAADRSEERMRVRIDIIYAELFQWMLQIHQLPGGALRAETVQKLIDQSIAANPSSLPISCRKSCAFCCHTPVSVTKSEVDQIYNYLRTHRISWNRDRGSEHSKNACSFLSRDNSCKIYEARPLACRKLMAVSQAELCNSEEAHSPSYLLYIEAELIAAAFYNVESLSAGVVRTIADYFETNPERNHCRTAFGSISFGRSEADDI